MNPLIFEVAFIPKEVRTDPPPMCVVIDVIRASTSMVTMLEKGCSEIILTSDEKETYEKFRVQGIEDILICSENDDGTAAEFADFSPSISSIRQASVKGKKVIFRTTNGTRAAQTLWKQGVNGIFIGCMHNAKAVMNEVVQQAAESQKNITIVCSGRERGEIPTTDDVYTAGILMKYARMAADRLELTYVLKDSAKIAEHVNLVYEDTVAAFSDSGSGETMRRIQSTLDIALCSKENVSNLIPFIEFSGEGETIIAKKLERVINP
ncbi:2-phosphosulfolactate phosphatase [Terrilactibacillus laevilacticus]|uniref:Probable 2-phosphosulfolactate phosphatase n=1 Tax=Terrilactibacillus laevilacticus TaxID=1380157 RepID=A0ABW5PMX7_9BACI|nr:2-phosphosulfolactate phosphatase [Terrilactibacillus laevilacticus]